ncbi:uncharacterized protein LOC115226739 [Octopus sinensis]|uniref:Uncharacterized protein LOC115226739 n=1 Tax=Octopus sinensis TaxID=2607531 RepID=A0A6P7TUM2_9MOLL|nr:uncharacterized protein LOC115226739 [Octopus sinensis]
MEDQTENTLRKLIPQKWALSYSTPKGDEEGVDNQRGKYEEDDGSRRSDEGYCSVISERESAVKAISVARLNTHGDKESTKETEKQIVAKIQRIRLQYDRCMMFMEHIVKESKHYESLGLSANCILEKVKERLGILLKYTKEQNISIEQDLEWFQQRLFDIYVTSNPYNHKTIEPAKVTTKFRPLQPVVTREANIEESGEEFEEIPIISNIVIIEEGVMTYSHNCKIISLVTRDSDRIDVHCPSSVTSFTRISEDMVLATLPFHEMILIISPKTLKIKRIKLGLHMVSYLEDSTLIGVEMFGKTVYQLIGRIIPLTINLLPRNPYRYCCRGPEYTCNYIRQHQQSNLLQTGWPTVMGGRDPFSAPPK